MSGVSPRHVLCSWRKVFNSRLVSSVSRFASVYFYAVVVVLLLLLLGKCRRLLTRADAIREVRKYSDADVALETRRALENDAVIHMRLFRSQRNLYISGFALLLFVVINRIVTLIARTAALQASADAALKQAQSANQAAKTLMEAVSLFPHPLLSLGRRRRGRASAQEGRGYAEEEAASGRNGPRRHEDPVREPAGGVHSSLHSAEQEGCK